MSSEGEFRSVLWDSVYQTGITCRSRLPAAFPRLGETSWYDSGICKSEIEWMLCRTPGGPAVSTCPGTGIIASGTGKFRWLRAIMSLICFLPSALQSEISDVPQRWAPGIGDPTPIGWFTVFAYLCVLIMCIVNWVNARHLSKDRFIWFWISLSIAFLCVNKQLDLQTWMLQAGRDSAHLHNWYNNRRPIQIAFVALLAAFAISTVTVLRVYLAEVWPRFWLVVAGLAGLLFFIVMRATSIHHVDWVLGLTLGSVKVNAVVELTSISVVAAGATLWLRRRPQPTAAERKSAVTSADGFDQVRR
jgi:hypothetical protein